MFATAWRCRKAQERIAIAIVIANNRRDESAGGSRVQWRHQSPHTRAGQKLSWLTLSKNKTLEEHMRRGYWNDCRI